MKRTAIKERECHKTDFSTTRRSLPIFREEPAQKISLLKMDNDTESQNNIMSMRMFDPFIKLSPKCINYTDGNLQGGMRLRGLRKEGRNRKLEPSSFSRYSNKSVDEVVTRAREHSEHLFTIITVVYNGVNSLEAAILSVLNQDYDNVEYIVIDGGSTDGTQAILNKYDEFIDYWISEEDEGLYDAMNKGIKLARGDYIGILNADDILYRSTLSNYANLIKTKDYGFLYSSVDILDESNEVVDKFAPILPSKYKYFLRRMPFAHMSLVVAYETFLNLGIYNCKYRLSSDFDFIDRVFDAKVEGRKGEFVCGGFKVGGLSSNYLQSLLDTRRVIRDKGYRIRSWIWFIHRWFRSTIGRTTFGKAIKNRIKIKLSKGKR